MHHYRNAKPIWLPHEAMRSLCVIDARAEEVRRAVAAGLAWATTKGLWEKNCYTTVVGIESKTTGMTYHTAFNPGYPSGQRTIAGYHNQIPSVRRSVSDFYHLFDANGHGSKVDYSGSYYSGRNYCTPYAQEGVSVRTRWRPARRVSPAAGWLAVLLGVASACAGATPATPASPPTTLSAPVSVSETPSVTSSVPTTSLEDEGEPLAPITGYGDFSDVEYWDVDPFEVVQLLVQCANDEGFPVKLIPSGDGISFADVPPEQSAMAGAVLDACEEGLHLPAPVPAPRAVKEEIYQRMIEVKACLEEQGYAVADPPSLETFIESWDTDPWNPYDSIPLSLNQDEWLQLQVACPQR